MTIWKCFIDNRTGRLECDDTDSSVMLANILYWTDKSLGYWLQFARKHASSFTAISYNDETGEVKFLGDYEEHVS